MKQLAVSKIVSFFKSTDWIQTDLNRHISWNKLRSTKKIPLNICGIIPSFMNTVFSKWILAENTQRFIHLETCNSEHIKMSTFKCLCTCLHVCVCGGACVILSCLSYPLNGFPFFLFALRSLPSQLTWSLRNFIISFLMHHFIVFKHIQECLFWTRVLVGEKNTWITLT